MVAPISRLNIRAEHWAVAAIGTAFIVLATWYSLSEPILESYDEPFHFSYVLSIALDHGLPVQDVEHVGPWGNEGSQPPLYYLIAAATTFWTDRAGFAGQVERNPYTTRHSPVEQNDNRNFFIHRSGEQLPYTGNVLGFHLARLLSALCGAGALLATYLAAREVFPSQPELALGAIAFQAFIPSFIYVSSTLSNDALLVFLASLSLWLIVRVARRSSISSRESLRLGALIGLATLAKLSALPLLAVAVFTIVLASRLDFRISARQCALLVLAFLAVTGWWFARNQWLYGEWLGTGIMNRIAGLRSVAPQPADIWSDVLNAEQSFWAVFGSGNVHPPEALLIVPRALALAGIVSCGFALLRSRARWLRRMANVNTLAVFLLWGVLFTAAFAWWLLNVEHTNGRLLYPLLTPLAIAIAFGIRRLTHPWGRAGIAASGASMLALATAMPLIAIGPAYAKPPAVSLAQVSGVARPIQVDFGDVFRLLGYRLYDDTLRGGEPLHVDLYWQALTRPAVDYTVYLHALGHDDRLIGGVDTFPGRGSFPTPDWTPGTIYRDTLALYLDTQPADPVAATLVVGWYDTRTQKALAPIAGTGRAGMVTVGRVRVPSGGPVAYNPERTLAGNFDNQIDLWGYDLAADALVLYWRARTQPRDDYTVFVQVFDAAGHMSVQADSQPRSGDYPTTFWRTGEIVRDEHRLVWPADTAYILVGLYRLETGARLRLAGSSDDALMLRP